MTMEEKELSKLRKVANNKVNEALLARKDDIAEYTSEAVLYLNKLFGVIKEVDIEDGDIYEALSLIDENDRKRFTDDEAKEFTKDISRSANYLTRRTEQECLRAIVAHTPLQFKSEEEKQTAK